MLKFIDHSYSRGWYYQTNGISKSTQKSIITKRTKYFSELGYFLAGIPNLQTLKLEVTLDDGFREIEEDYKSSLKYFVKSYFDASFLNVRSIQIRLCSAPWDICGKWMNHVTFEQELLRIFGKTLKHFERFAAAEKAGESFQLVKWIGQHCGFHLNLLRLETVWNVHLLQSGSRKLVRIDRSLSNPSQQEYSMQLAIYHHCT